MRQTLAVPRPELPIRQRPSAPRVRQTAALSATITRLLPAIAVFATLACAAASGADGSAWWNHAWQFRTRVTRPTPYRDGAERAVETVIDFPQLLAQAGVAGTWDPASIRVIQPEPLAEIPVIVRDEFNAARNRHESYLAWYASGTPERCGVYDIYFNTTDRPTPPAQRTDERLPPENLLVNAGFEQADDGLPTAWQMRSAPLIRLGRFAHTSDRQSLAVVVDQTTPADANREAAISQQVDVRRFAGQEMVFQCDLFAERAIYGAPVSIELEQTRADGSLIQEYAVDPRWLTIELARGQLVQFCERGRFSPDAATLTVRVRVRCHVTDADTNKAVTGPESFFTVWLDRMVVRPGERWPWPVASHAGFVPGALRTAPLNRGFAFTEPRFLMFNGASEGTLTRGIRDPGPASVHWGLQAGTLEFWCQPTWDAGDDVERVFFDSVAYMHRRQCTLRKRGADGRNELEFLIADADQTPRVVRGPAPLASGRWHHIAATWDFPRAHLALFVDGQLVARQGPGTTAWPSSLEAAGTATKGIGIFERDSRSMPMQVCIGRQVSGAVGQSAEAVIDELRISDIERYADSFTPPRDEFTTDEHTRALFHFENEPHGVHAGDDRFVRGHLCLELPTQEESATLELRTSGEIDSRTVVVQPHAPVSLFEANRAEGRLPTNTPFSRPPDPRYIEYREHGVERTLSGENDRLSLTVGGDYPPLMRSVTYERAAEKADASAPNEAAAKGSATQPTAVLPAWQANGAVVPLSVDSLRATLGEPAGDDEAKAIEAFRYALRSAHYYDASYCETLPTLHRPRISYTFLKALNIYPYDQCGPLNHMLRKLLLSVGISSNDASGTHHQFQQAFYQGQWRLFDLSARVFWLDRDNTTIIGRRRIEEDPYLKIRQGGDACAWLQGRPTGIPFGTALRPHDMGFALRAGERASLCWHNEGRWFEVSGDRQPLPLAKIPPLFGNGAIVYEPTDAGDATSLENMVVERLDDGRTRLRPADAAKPASLIYRAQCPYIFSDAIVRGVYTTNRPDGVRLALSFDEGRHWTEAWRSAARRGELDAELRAQVTARYAYWLKLELSPDAAGVVEGLQVRGTVVVSSLALPGKLALGVNPIAFVGGAGQVPITTACRWTERYRSELAVAVDALSFYTEGDELHRNVLVVAPGGEVPIRVKFHGRGVQGEVRLADLPAGWTCTPERHTIELTAADQMAEAEFVLRAPNSQPGEIQAVTVVLGDGDAQRRTRIEVLAAQAPLVREAETHDELVGMASVRDVAELSGASGVEFTGSGRLGFDFTASRNGTHALWVRARWPLDADPSLSYGLDDQSARPLRVTRMIGFEDWDSPSRANTKRFHKERNDHWAWYRIADIELTAGKHRLTLGAGQGAWLDALILLPQTDSIDRAAMNLFQNWNYAPWQNPF